ncbi:MAG: ATP-binding protein, partial [Deltaproteobacteria bacterium]|nr:ATP-binding protein [Deltaproteobacteria bacterium]
SGDLARIDFAQYIRSLAADLFRSYGVSSGAITLKINAGDVLLGIDRAIPCGLIVNELVSNSLKHAFPAGKKGEIQINLRSDNDNGFTLTLSDNGVGFPKDLDFRNAETLGLQLVITLVKQIEGTIELDRSGGTEFKITFARYK